MRRTSSLVAACPITPNAKSSRANKYGQVDDLPQDKVSPEVYKYYIRAIGASPAAVAILFYFLYQVSEN